MKNNVRPLDRASYWTRGGNKHSVTVIRLHGKNALVHFDFEFPFRQKWVRTAKLTLVVRAKNVTPKDVAMVQGWAKHTVNTPAPDPVEG